MNGAKAVQEVEAPVSGALPKILLAQGESAPVNTDIGLIEKSDEGSSTVIPRATPSVDYHAIEGVIAARFLSTG